ncbi:hypothetical protein [Tepidibacillus marianensis]
MSGPTERAISERINLDASNMDCQSYELAKKIEIVAALSTFQ